MPEGHAEAFLVFVFKRNRTLLKGVKPSQTRRAPPHTSPGTLDSGNLSLLIREKGIKHPTSPGTLKGLDGTACK